MKERKAKWRDLELRKLCLVKGDAEQFDGCIYHFRSVSTAMEDGASTDKPTLHRESCRIKESQQILVKCIYCTGSGVGWEKS